MIYLQTFESYSTIGKSIDETRWYNSQRNEIYRFNWMKYLQTYESYEQHLKLAAQMAKEICYELEDEGYEVIITTESKVPSWAKEPLKHGAVVKHEEQTLKINISRRGYFTINDIIREVVDRLILVLGKGEVTDPSLKGRGGYRLEDYPGFGNIEPYIPKVKHYYKSNRNNGDIIIDTPNGAFWVIMRTGYIEGIECLKSDLTLIFEN